MSNEKLKCVFCGGQIGSRTEGCNPMPLVDNDTTAVCCRKCNARFVVPARERLLRALNEEREQVLEIVTKEREHK